MNRAALTVKLQIAAAVFVPMLALGLWLNSVGFFSLGDQQQLPAVPLALPAPATASAP